MFPRSLGFDERSQVKGDPVRSVGGRTSGEKVRPGVVLSLRSLTSVKRPETTGTVPPWYRSRTLCQHEGRKKGLMGSGSVLGRRTSGNTETHLDREPLFPGRTGTLSQRCPSVLLVTTGVPVPAGGGDVGPQTQVVPHLVPVSEALRTPNPFFSGMTYCLHVHRVCVGSGGTVHLSVGGRVPSPWSPGPVGLWART